MDIELTAEEKAAEVAATTLPKEDEVRAAIIEEYGFDPEADAERIDKLVAKDMDSRKKLSDAIGQKIKHRNDANSLRSAKPNVQAESPDGLSNKDVLFLAKADVHEDDMDELVEYAKFKKLPLSEAYKSYKGVLDVKAEERRTAAAANTKGGPRGTSKVSGEDLLAKAETTGEVPTSTEGMQNLFLARQMRKAGKK